MASASLVLYDGECTLCCTLAAFMARRDCAHFGFQSWQSFVLGTAEHSGLDPKWRELPADVLRVWDDGTMHEGAAAWAHLLDVCKDFSGLMWLASQLGLSQDRSATLLMKAASTAKRFCVRCGKGV